MRFVSALGLIPVAVALMEALPWEVSSWYEVYKIERIVWPDDPSNWVIGRDCDHHSKPKDQDDENFNAEVRLAELPANTVTIAEFMRCIGTKGSLSKFGKSKGPNQPRFKTLRYSMHDMLDEVRALRAAKKSPAKITAKYLLKHKEFPTAHLGPGDMFDMARLQRIIGEHAEYCRTQVKAGTPAAEKVESWVANRAGALRVVNMYRRSDQAAWKAQWVDRVLKYGPSSNYEIKTRPNTVVFPDGSTPAVSNYPGDKHLETWDEIDIDRTIAQGGHSMKAEERRKKARREAGRYGRWGGDSDPHKVTATMHVSIIRANERIIEFHEGEVGAYLSCRNPNRGRSHSVPVLKPMSKAAL